MNKIYIMGKVKNISKLYWSYTQKRKISIYVDLQIYSRFKGKDEVFNCLLEDDNLDNCYYMIKKNDFLYVVGNVVNDDDIIKINIERIFFL